MTIHFRDKSYNNYKEKYLRKNKHDSELEERVKMIKIYDQMFASTS